jgi:hypothetical protein
MLRERRDRHRKADVVNEVGEPGEQEGGQGREGHGQLLGRTRVGLHPLSCPGGRLVFTRPPVAAAKSPPTDRPSSWPLASPKETLQSYLTGVFLPSA